MVLAYRVVIGHALSLPTRNADRVTWDRWISAGFAMGAACFFMAPFPGFVQLAEADADGMVFFAGSLLFTLAAGLELREATLARGARWGEDPVWWSAAVQFAGTLLFNLNTYDAMREGLSSRQENRLIFAPDLLGSACFLISGSLAYVAVTGRGREWRMAAVNLAGCVLFGVAALASFVVPSTGSILDVATVNWCTSLGALCFLIGALLLLPTRSLPKEASP